MKSNRLRSSYFPSAYVKRMKLYFILFAKFCQKTSKKRVQNTSKTKHRRDPKKHAESRQNGTPGSPGALPGGAKRRVLGSRRGVEIWTKKRRPKKRVFSTKTDKNRRKIFILLLSTGQKALKVSLLGEMLPVTKCHFDQPIW